MRTTCTNNWTSPRVTEPGHRSLSAEQPLKPLTLVSSPNATEPPMAEAGKAAIEAGRLEVGVDALVPAPVAGFAVLVHEAVGRAIIAVDRCIEPRAALVGVPNGVGVVAEALGATFVRGAHCLTELVGCLGSPPPRSCSRA